MNAFRGTETMNQKTRHWIGILILWNLLQTFPLSSIHTDISKHFEYHEYTREYDWQRVGHMENFLSATNPEYLTRWEVLGVERHCESISKYDFIKIDDVIERDYLTEREKKAIVATCG